MSHLVAPLIAACGDPARSFQACTAGGDDYELLFAVPAERRAELAALSARLDLPLHRIGRLTTTAGRLQLRHANGQLDDLAVRGYDHFGRNT